MFFKDGFRNFLQNDGKSYVVVAFAQWRKHEDEFPSDKTLLICLPVEEVYGLWLTLPENMTKDEQATAAFWELDANLQEQGLSAEDFVVRGFAYPKVTGENYWLAAVRRDVLQEIESEISAQMTNFDLLAVPSELSSEEIMALYREQKIGLSSQSEAERWNYRRLSVLVLVATLLLVTVTGISDVIHYIGAQKELQIAEQQKQSSLPVVEKLERLQNEQKIVDAKQRQIVDLQAKTLPWYSALVHLGTVAQVGVTMQSAELAEDKNLQIKGTATDYDALTKYAQLLGQDNFFAGNVQLQEATAKEGEGIAFELALSLAKV